MQLNLTSEIVTLDDQLLLWLNQFMYKWPFLDRTASWLLNASIFKFGPLVMAVCWYWFETGPNQARNRKLLAEAIVISFVAVIATRFLVLALPFRDRPAVNPDLHFIVPFNVGLRTWSSFPSDHAVMAFALATSLFRISPKIGIWACFHAVVFICLPRLYFGLHYPSDLIGGALIGVALVFAISPFQKVRLTISSFITDAEQTNPAMFYTIGFLVLYEVTELFDSFRAFAIYVFHVIRHIP